MEFYHNVYIHTKGKYKGRIDDEYYAIREKQVLCIYIPRSGKELEVSLSYWDSSWDFGTTKIDENEYRKPLIKAVFSKYFNVDMYTFYKGEK